MRHSDIRLTVGVYTDPKLLDVRAAVAGLPALPLNNGDAPVEGQTAVVGSMDGRFARRFAGTECKPVQTRSRTVPSGRNSDVLGQAEPGAATSSVDKRKDSPTIPVSESLVSGRLDSNQRPPEPHSGALAKLRHAPNPSPVRDSCVFVTTPRRALSRGGQESATRTIGLWSGRFKHDAIQAPHVAKADRFRVGPNRLDAQCRSTPLQRGGAASAVKGKKLSEWPKDSLRESRNCSRG